MFYSDISAGVLVQDIENELNIAPHFPASTFAGIINSVEQLLYSEIIREIKGVDCSSIVSADGIIDLSQIPVGDGEDHVKCSDVTRILLSNGSVFTDLIRLDADEAKINGYKYFYTLHSPDKISVNNDYINYTVFYVIRPKPKTVTGNFFIPDRIYLPDEFIPLLSARIRGELCKLIGDDNQAAKWLNDYNTYLDDFTLFINGRNRL